MSLTLIPSLLPRRRRIRLCSTPTCRRRFKTNSVDSRTTHPTVTSANPSHKSLHPFSFLFGLTKPRILYARRRNDTKRTIFARFRTFDLEVGWGEREKVVIGLFFSSTLISDTISDTPKLELIFCPLFCRFLTGS